jgi:hypothetical protein
VRRLLLLVTVAAVMAALMVTIAGQALAQEPGPCLGARKAFSNQEQHKPGGANEAVSERVAANCGPAL